MGGLQINMGNAPPISAWLDVLRAVMPPRGVLVVGAGTGNGPWVQWLQHRGIRPVWLVEGDKAQYQYLERRLLSNEGWVLRHDVVAETTDAVVFHHASNPAESGLLAPEQLRNLWPHLELINTEEIEVAKTLKTLFVETKGDINWLVLDCLPATVLLMGAGQLLANTDVVVVRIVSDEQLSTELGVHHDAADALLCEAGLTCVHLIPQRHPALAYAIYARDVMRQKAGQLRDVAEAAQLQQICQQLHSEAQQAQAIAKQQVRALETQLEQRMAELVSLQQAREQLAQQLAQQNDALRRSQEELTTARLVQEKTHAEWAEQHMVAEQNIFELKDQIKKQQLCIDELSRDQIEAKKSVANKTNDAIGFDNFVEDIEPYLFGKSITYVDVGAFVGDIFKFIVDSKKIRVREAHLIEPNPESYEKLISGLKNSRIPALHTYNMGISDAVDTLRFSVAASMTKVVADTHSLVVSGDSCDIRCSPLDEISQFFTDGRIDLLKIDVEGHELAVLRGAETLLKNSSVDIIYIEVGFNISGTQQAYFSEVDQFLQKYGYRCFNIYEKTSEWIQDTPWLRRCNFAYFSSPFAINNPRKLTMENRRLKQLLDENEKC